jgi:dTDP-4-dehydrorhamnose reductase
MSTLILGDGYVGRAIFQSLVHQKKVVVQARKDLDYHNQSVLRKYIINNDIKTVVNCSGYTGSPNVDSGESNKELCWKLNVEVPLDISKTCKDLNVDLIHISSGCIYTGYDKEYTEEDAPNFGMFDVSSFYSKTKHAYERLAQYGCVLRIRMPITNSLKHARNYITKILKYDNIINYRNSKTYLPDLGAFVNYIIDNDIRPNSIGLLNFVNPDAMFTSQVIDKLNAYGIKNPNHKYVEIDDLNIIAPRSNCVLNIDKLTNMFSDFYLQSEDDVIERAALGILKEQ